MKVLLPVFLLITSFSFLTCKQGNDNKDLENDSQNSKINFESHSWKLQEKMDFPFREAMVDDLMKSRLLKPLDSLEIINLLGEPTRANLNYLYYMVKQERIGLFPLHTKTLVIELSLDSTENRIMIHE